MTILTVRHVTTYRYRRPVAFGEHRMMFRPRDSYDQRLIDSRLLITPEPASLRWIHDPFGNCVALARFDTRASELRFESTIRVGAICQWQRIMSWASCVRERAGDTASGTNTWSVASDSSGTSVADDKFPAFPALRNTRVGPTRRR